MDKPTRPGSMLVSSRGSLRPDSDLTGRTLGDYYLLRRLGQGGMGEVYLAEQTSLKRKVALKLLRKELAANPTALQRFKAEAEAVARATHANIVQVYASGQEAGLHFIALEYVEGRNLREFMTRKGPPDVLLAISIMRQVAAALQRASELGIIHRDIKPENIMLTRKGEVKVADFGLSRVIVGDKPALNLTQSGVTMGTPLYMSPEQVEGKDVDCRTDIYSFGVTAYAMMAGQAPFQGATPFEIALQHVQKEPKPLAAIRPDLPEALCAIIHKMMAKSPDERYQTGRELLKDLSRLRETLGGVTGPLGPSSGLSAKNASYRTIHPTLLPTPTQAIPAGRRWLPLLVGLSLVLAVSAGMAFAWLWHPARATGPVLVVDESGFDAMHKREQTLLQAAEQYLIPGPNGHVSPTGRGLCLDLGVFYLDHHRLDDAAKWFERLEAVKQPGYANIGRLGQAIVLALRNQAKQSNEMFKALCWGEKVKKPISHISGILDQSARARFWIAEAVHYNKANGSPFPSEARWTEGMAQNLRNAFNQQ